MKKLVIIFSILILGLAVQAEPTDYEQIYRDMPVPDFSYVHDVDPGEYYDTERSTWSPYPLLRLTAPLYFKTISIAPGYYLLTPRQQDGNWYYLDNSGAMQTGWLKDNSNNTLYYCDPGIGIMAKEWKQINGSWYYFNTSGAMQTGWIRNNSTGAYYYLQSNGVMAANTTLNINGVNYSFDQNGVYTGTTSGNVSNVGSPSGNVTGTNTSPNAGGTLSSPNMSPSYTNNQGNSAPSSNYGPGFVGSGTGSSPSGSSSVTTATVPTVSTNSGSSSVITGSNVSNAYDSYGNLIPGLTSGPPV